MKSKRWISIAALGLAIALPMAAQQAGSAPEAKDVKRKTVVVRDGERVEVFSGDDGARRIFAVGGGYLGISPVGMTDELRAHFGAPKGSGVMVGKVHDETPAAKAGLRVGDILTQVDGQKVESTFDISRALRGKKKGDQVRIDFIRDRAQQHSFVTVEERSGANAWTVTAPFAQVEIDTEGLERAMEGARAMAAPDGRARVFQFGDCGDLQSRIKDLESRLKDLEKRLK